ncbi:MAG: VWA domain-containing protein [Bacteroidia bacterium]|nr:VWA domain-containing protein [Bacteroidia bacterium]MCF8425800.1 VWA domain-containing protein [Bacteroidia bacterium]
MLQKLKHSLLVFGLILSVFALEAQTTKPIKTRILFLLDASGSMYARLETDSRINIAKRLLTKTLDSLESKSNVEVALRVYGHTSPPNARNCRDTRLEVPFRANNFDEVKKRLETITPKGTTLIAHSLLQSAYDFPKEPYTRNVIILITDGIEECQGDPCAVSEALQSQGVILKPFIIGIGSTVDFRKAFECVGKYYDANTEQGFEDALNIVISQALNNTTAQVNLLDVYSKPTETNVNMSFYDMNSGLLMYNYMHTINERGNPDTILLDPIYRYKMVVHTIPPVVKENIDVTPGKHTIIGVDAPQGQFTIKVEGLTNYANLQYIIRKRGSYQTLHVQDASSKEKYLVGKYDVEVLCLPRMIFKDVNIDQSATTTIQLPQPGKLIVNCQLKDYYADIYQMVRNEMTWVCKLPVEKRTHQLIIQPGDYKIVYRSKGATRSSHTFERLFKVTSGMATNIILN